jgi:hypothetical protein
MQLLKSNYQKGVIGVTTFFVSLSVSLQSNFLFPEIKNESREIQLDWSKLLIFDLLKNYRESVIDGLYPSINSQT